MRPCQHPPGRRNVSKSYEGGPGKQSRCWHCNVPHHSAVTDAYCASDHRRFRLLADWSACQSHVSLSVLGNFNVMFIHSIFPDNSKHFVATRHGKSQCIADFFLVAMSQPKMSCQAQLKCPTKWTRTSGVILCTFPERKRRECWIYYSRDEDVTMDNG